MSQKETVLVLSNGQHLRTFPERAAWVVQNYRKPLTEDELINELRGRSIEVSPIDPEEIVAARLVINDESVWEFYKGPHTLYPNNEALMLPGPTRYFSVQVSGGETPDQQLYLIAESNALSTDLSVEKAKEQVTQYLDRFVNGPM